MRDYRVCKECKYYVRTKEVRNAYGYCQIGKHEGDLLHMRRPLTKCCRKYEEQK